MRTGQRSFLAVALAAGLLGAACGSDSGSGSSGGGGGGGQGCSGNTSPSLCVTVAMTGSVPLSGTYQLSGAFFPFGATSCSAFAAGTRDGKFHIDRPTSGLLSGTGFTFAITINDYHGPGTYTINYLQVVSIGSSNLQPKSITLNEKADGSGGFTIADATDDRNNTDSGTISWTCS